MTRPTDPNEAVATAVTSGGNTVSGRTLWLAVARVVWLITGVVWAVSGLVLLTDVEYWDPVTSLDYVAVWSYSLGWLGLAVSILLLAGLVASRPVAIVAVVVALGAAAAGIANGIEDGLGMKALGTLYVIGVLVAAFGLLPLILAAFGGLAIAPSWFVRSAARPITGVADDPIGRGV